MRYSIRNAFLLIAFLLFALPVSAVLALLLYPFWSWVEAGTGIESIGHSGPAGWCFIATYVVVAGVTLGLTRRFQRRSSSRQP